MSDKSLLQDESRSALRDGAARLDQFVQQVRAHQTAMSQGGAVEQNISLSPDEAWSKNFMNQAIGPRLEVPRITGFTPPPMPQVSLEVAPTPRETQSYRAQPEEQPAARTAPQLDGPAPMHESRDRDVPSRSWLSRLFRRES